VYCSGVEYAPDVPTFGVLIKIPLMILIFDDSAFSTFTRTDNARFSSGASLERSEKRTPRRRSRSR
jgi:hypothetical protein